ncbi:MAG: hypothetical protein WC985_08510 [Thermoplasmata archaeon]
MNESTNPRSAPRPLTLILLMEDGSTRRILLPSEQIEVRGNLLQLVSETGHRFAELAMEPCSAFLPIREVLMSVGQAERVARTYLGLPDLRADPMASRRERPIQEPTGTPTPGGEPAP